MTDGFEELGLLPLRHKQGPLEYFNHAPVELADCNVLLVSCALTENERSAGMRIEDWPAGVRVRIWGQIEGYFKTHADREVRLLSTGMGNGVCFALVHHAPKAKAADVLSSAATIKSPAA